MIEIKLMQSQQRVDALKKSGRPFAAPATILGLVDTGATSTALDRSMVSVLDLGLKGPVAVHTPSTGPAYQTRDVYDATIVLGETQPDPMPITLLAIETDLASEGFFALIGRDVLKFCILTYDGPGDLFTLEWRRPPLASPDRRP